MEIERLGHLYKTVGDSSHSQSHAQVPFAFVLKNGDIRVFYATRDALSRSSVCYVDFDENFNRKDVSKQPSIVHGKQGYFDDAGVMPSWFVDNGDELLMYYTAWNRSDEASYQLSIGIASSKNSGKTFERLYEGPIMDRDKYDPVWVGQPCVLKDKGIWKMWYLSCQKISVIDGHPEPFYNVKYAESIDGIIWDRKNVVCIDLSDNVDAIGRPCVFIRNGKYYMFHSNRTAYDYRQDSNKSYHIVLSESTDGIKWRPTDLSWKGHKQEWESTMQEYCSVFKMNAEWFMLYNGNGFGASGFGLAKLKFND